jgi:hypothetical protein
MRKAVFAQKPDRNTHVKNRAEHRENGLDLRTEVRRFWRFQNLLRITATGFRERVWKTEDSLCVTAGALELQLISKAV